MILTPDQQHTLAFALEIAARQYDQDEQQMRAARDTLPDARRENCGYHRMAEQFKRQREEADALCDLIREASHVALGGL